MTTKGGFFPCAQAAISVSGQMDVLRPGIRRRGMNAAASFTVIVKGRLKANNILTVRHHATNGTKNMAPQAHLSIIAVASTSLAKLPEPLSRT